jgi:hypothetical protein
MNWLAENALPIWMGGAVALTMASIIYFQTRAKGAAIGIVGVLTITASLLLFNWWVETPREAVERTLYQLAATVESNDVPGTLAFLAPSAAPQLRKDVETLMPQVRIERARIIGTPQIELNASDDAASVICRGIVVAVNKQGGTKGGDNDRLWLTWVRHGDRWQLESYVSQKDWHAASEAYQRSAKRSTQLGIQDPGTLQEASPSH